VSESPAFAEQPTLLLVASSITPWYKVPSPLDKECSPLIAVRTHSTNDPAAQLLHDSPTLAFDGYIPWYPGYY
jgi:hypothetical protein